MEDNLLILSDLKKMFLQANSSAQNSTIKISLPHFLYATSEQAKAYEKATHGNESYTKRLDSPITELIEQHSEQIIEGLSNAVQFIDLGPGYPSKSLRLLDKLNVSHSLTYFPVDVSPYFLDRAAWTATARGISTHKQLSRFEEVGPLLDRKLHLLNVSRFVFLGLTFNNFTPDYILKILDGLMGSKDRCLICCQSATGVSDEQLVAPYDTPEVAEFCFLPLGTLGFQRKDFIFLVEFENDAVRVRFKNIRPVKYEKTIIPANTKFETSASYRFETASIEKKISNLFEITQTYSLDNQGLFLYILKGRGG